MGLLVRRNPSRSLELPMRSAIEARRQRTPTCFMKVSDCRIIDLPKIAEPRGNLTFIESARHVPFPIARVYYLYDVPGGAERGGHAHRVLEQFVVAMSGSFDVVLDDGCDRARFHLN